MAVQKFMTEDEKMLSDENLKLKEEVAKFRDYIVNYKNKTEKFFIATNQVWWDSITREVKNG